ncbi:MAG: hypothetical protein ACYS1A_17490 [Planctomycetota bacterium]|jgi:hypothetical protein
MKDDSETRQKFSEIMWGLADVFGGEISQSGLKVRFAALYEYSINDISSAAAYLLRYRKVKFPAVPTVAEIVEIIEKNNSPEAVAERQADFVLAHLGSRSYPQYNDDITRKLMSDTWPFGSWSQSVLQKDLGWWRKDFIKAYVDIAERERYSKIRESLSKLGYDGLKKLE